MYSCIVHNTASCFMQAKRAWGESGRKLCLTGSEMTIKQQMGKLAGDKLQHLWADSSVVIMHGRLLSTSEGDEEEERTRTIPYTTELKRSPIHAQFSIITWVRARKGHMRRKSTCKCCARCDNRLWHFGPGISGHRHQRNRTMSVKMASPYSLAPELYLAPPRTSPLALPQNNLIITKGKFRYFHLKVRVHFQCAQIAISMSKRRKKCLLSRKVIVLGEPRGLIASLIFK